MITTILLGITSLLGFVIFRQSQSAGALLENLDTKKDLNKQDVAKYKNDGLLESEEQKRKDAEAAASEEKAKKGSNEELADFFNGKK